MLGLGKNMNLRTGGAVMIGAITGVALPILIKRVNLPAFNMFGLLPANWSAPAVVYPLFTGLLAFFLGLYYTQRTKKTGLGYGLMAYGAVSTVSAIVNAGVFGQRVQRSSVGGVSRRASVSPIMQAISRLQNSSGLALSGSVVGQSFVKPPVVGPPTRAMFI